VLKAAFAEGRLDMDEYADRVGRVHSSRTYAELATITADLPVGPLGTLPAAAAPVSSALMPAVPAAATPMAVPDRSGISALAVTSTILGLLAVYAAVTWDAVGFPAVLLGLFALPATAAGRKHGRVLAIIGIVLGVVAVFRVG
jgi:hypothetical protein